MQSCPANGHLLNTANQTRKGGKNITKLDKSANNFLQDSDNERCFLLTGEPKQSPETQIVIGQMEVRVLIDSGVSVNIIHQHIFKQLQKGDNTIKL